MATPAACPATTTLNFSPAGFAGFSVTISCSLQSFSEGVNTMNIFTVTSVGEYGNLGDLDYVSRRLEVTVNRRV